MERSALAEEPCGKSQQAPDSVVDENSKNDLLAR
jgi:hypothetical protein